MAISLRPGGSGMPEENETSEKSIDYEQDGAGTAETLQSGETQNSSCDSDLKTAQDRYLRLAAEFDTIKSGLKRIRTNSGNIPTNGCSKNCFRFSITSSAPFSTARLQAIRKASFRELS
jgi:hypothetical protein